MKKTLLILLLLGGAIGAYGYYGARTVEFVPDISTVTLTAGDIADTVGATGALEAVTTVKVGSQVSGIIQELNVDFNSIVRENDVIMRPRPVALRDADRAGTRKPATRRSRCRAAPCRRGRYGDPTHSRGGPRLP